ncbi:MAG: 50S ribosomal protein L25/general stress protein Ctc [Gammaproteobacteria bacterium]|nr:MAG: 50S ribosomal protein L25/general stress protein Ctc [Gammaproteobacteria bacterium]
MTDANAFSLKAEVRDDIGKGASRRLRREDKIPAVIYGGEEEPQSVAISHFDILKCLNDNSFYSQLIDINIDGEVTETILRDLQRHPYKPTVLHADFQRVVRGQELTVNVSLECINADEAKGVKAGGILSQSVIDVEIVCRPSNLPEKIEVDVTDLEMNESLRLTDIKLPEGVRLLDLEGVEDEDDDDNIVIVSIHPPRAEEVVEEASTEDEIDVDVESDDDE